LIRLEKLRVISSLPHPLPHLCSRLGHWTAQSNRSAVRALVPPQATARTFGLELPAL
jgi:hypothetical protein